MATQRVLRSVARNVLGTIKSARISITIRSPKVEQVTGDILRAGHKVRFTIVVTTDLGWTCEESVTVFVLRRMRLSSVEVRGVGREPPPRYPSP